VGRSYSSSSIGGAADAAGSVGSGRRGSRTPASPPPPPGPSTARRTSSGSRGAHSCHSSSSRADRSGASGTPVSLSHHIPSGRLMHPLPSGSWSAPLLGWPDESSERPGSSPQEPRMMSSKDLPTSALHWRTSYRTGHITHSCCPIRCATRRVVACSCQITQGTRFGRSACRTCLYVAADVSIVAVAMSQTRPDNQAPPRELGGFPRPHRPRPVPPAQELTLAALPRAATGSGLVIGVEPCLDAQFQRFR
jgi:hypothetical protein